MDLGPDLGGVGEGEEARGGGFAGAARAATAAAAAVDHDEEREQDRTNIFSVLGWQSCWLRRACVPAASRPRLPVDARSGGFYLPLVRASSATSPASDIFSLFEQSRPSPIFRGALGDFG
jgi:hypothetical protein